jgi:hypothetical protein
METNGGRCECVDNHEKVNDSCVTKCSGDTPERNKDGECEATCAS